MSDLDLIHRLLDGELSSAEEAALRERAAREPGLAEELAAYEGLVSAGGRIPRPEARPSLDERILAKIAELPKPRADSRTGVRIFALAAAILVLVGAAAFLGYHAGFRQGRQVTSASSSPREVVVQFTMAAPQAQRVELAGDFNGWRPAVAPLSRTSSGSWTTTVRLAPGRHEYQFVVDGQRWVPDPSAVETVDDGFGGRNAVIEIL